MRRTIEEELEEGIYKRPVKKTAKRLNFNVSNIEVIIKWPVFPKNIWQIIISMLSPYEQRLTRYWSKLFLSLKSDPVTDELRKIVRELSYDIPPEILSFEGLYFRSDRTLSLAEKESFMRKLESIWSYFHHNRPMQSGVYAEHKSRLLHLCVFADVKANKTSILNSHPLIISILIDVLYYSCLSPTNLGDYFGLINGVFVSCLDFINLIKLRQNLTNQQKQRIAIVEAVMFIKTNSLSEEIQLAEIKKILQIHELDYLPHSLSQFITAINNSEFYCNPDFRTLSLPLIVSSEVGNPLTPKPVEIVRGKYWVARNGDLIIHNDVINEINTRPKEWIRVIKFSLAFLGDIKQHIVRSTNPLFLEIFRRSFAAADFSVAFIKYCSIPAMKQALLRPEYRLSSQSDQASNKILPDRRNIVPLWLRRYLFTPELLIDSDHAFLLSLNIAELPAFVFKKDYTINELKRLVIYFRLRLSGMPDSAIESIVENNHSQEAICLVMAYRNPIDNFKDLILILNNLTAAELNRFIASDLFKTINGRGITNLYFWAWAAKNHDFLTSVMMADPVFFDSTLLNLFTLVMVPACNYSSNGRIFQAKAPITVSYFELIIRSFELVCAGQVLGKGLCENIFDRQHSILPLIIQHDYRKISAIMLARKSKSNKVEYWGGSLVDFYACRNKYKNFAPTCDFQHHMMNCISNDFMGRLSKPLYKNKSYVFWLSQLTHKALFMMLFSRSYTSQSNKLVIREGWLLQDDMRTGQGGYLQKTILENLTIFDKLEVLDKPATCCYMLQSLGVYNLQNTHIDALARQLFTFQEEHVLAQKFDAQMPVARIFESNIISEFADDVKTVLSGEEFNQISYAYFENSDAHITLINRVVTDNLNFLMRRNLENINYASTALRANVARSLCQLLLLFARNSLLDKPDYCHVLLDVFGVQSLFANNFPLNVLSGVDSIHDLKKLCMKIKLGAIKENISEQQYIANNMAVILARNPGDDYAKPSKRSRSSHSSKVEETPDVSNVNAMNAFGIFGTPDVASMDDQNQDESDFNPSYT